ncbi:MULTISPECIES: NAD(P)H-dependent oxidoreductase [Heyndrickxia]|jgi:glutathione-regulated potassium-efflux system ancillary protein KefG|uniref:NAD(P)H-dependent oxidoreductase n=1 Tax=Heyndrickxia TaxID=2837504 RepID=UPI001B039FB6|nr:NAD(P)H-dependent oxidoreductase [Heyndrickxia oleronia]GIN39254.1 putative NAD(P)H oxidoreductase YdeQ [Heyndrickxia oleronia]
MKKIMVIVAHPNIEASRGNKYWVKEIKKHPDIYLHHLYKQYPDWKIDVKKEQQLLLNHERIIFQFPFYWYSCPALLKKWFEEVISPEFGIKDLRLKGKEFMMATTTGGAKEGYQAGGYNAFTLSEYLRPIQGIIMRCQGILLPTFSLNNINNISDEDISDNAFAYVKEVKQDYSLKLAH